MLLVSTFVAISKIDGVGCFASQDIPNGTMIYLFDLDKDFPSNEENLTDHQI